MNRGVFASHAPDYHAAGANVIPIVPGQKIPPRDYPWSQWAETRQTNDDLDKLVDRYGHYDVGIVYGPASGLVDIEIDDTRGEERLSEIGLPPTACWKSKRGMHRPIRSRIFETRKLWRDPNNPRRFWGEILGAGRYAVAPDSGGRKWLTPDRLWGVGTLPDSFFDSVNHPLPSYTSLLASLDTSLLASVTTSLLASGGLEGVFRQEEVVQAVLPVLGIRAEVGRAFCCVLPGHGEGRPSASVFYNRRGGFVYRDWHGRSEEWLTLPEVRASQAYREVRKLRGPETAVWGLRLLTESGLVAPAIVDTSLPSGLSGPEAEMYQGFRSLLGCKWLHTPGDPSPFSWRFAAAWCGVSQKRAGEGIQGLLRQGYLRKVGEIKGMALFGLEDR